jgi:DUF4097 and DUF4098 domain-containing protein YvlB
MRRSTLLFIALTLGAASMHAAVFNAADVYEQEAPISQNGVLVISNPFGNVDIVGVEGITTVSFSVRRTVGGSERGAVDEARESSPLKFYGDMTRRFITTEVPLVHDPRWSIGVAYSIRVPRGVSIRLESHSSEKLHIANITGAVVVKNTNGTIALDNVTGPISAESANGNIVVDCLLAPSKDLALTTINGNVELSMPTSTSFHWSGQTLRGDFFSTIPIVGKFDGANFRASNTAPGPQIVTNSMMGNVYLLRRGTRPAEAKSLRALTGQPLQSVAARSFQAPLFNGDLVYTTPLGNISVGQVRGSARVETRAGEVRLGIVQSQCDVVSDGGPLTIGEVMGPLTARTRAGDVIINAAHNGAVISTGGGIIRMLFAAGATNLRSAGGDINVRQASGPITAQTASGDVMIALDPAVRQAAIDARTDQGNVMITVSSLLAADVEAIIMTSDPDANSIHSDFGGLTIHREQVGAKTRIRATGKVNGGGDRVSLYAEDGDITIRTETQSLVSGPQQH